MGGTIDFFAFVSFPNGGIIEGNQNGIGWDGLLAYVLRIRKK